MPFILAYGSQPVASTVKLGLAIVSFATMFNIPRNTHCDRLPANLETLLTVLWSHTTLKTEPWMTRQKRGFGFLWGVLEVLRWCGKEANGKAFKVRTSMDKHFKM